MSALAEQINGLIVLYNQGRLQEALERAAQLAQRYPDVPLIWNILGIVSAALGRMAEALAHYAKALQLQPDFAEAHCNLGGILNDLGRHEEAVVSCTRALEVRPGFAEASYNLGNALRGLGRNEEAVESLTRALQLKPGYAAAHVNLGITLSELGKHERAVASYLKALALASDRKDIWYNLSITLGGASFSAYSEQLESAFLGLLAQETAVRPSQVARSVTGFLKQHPLIKEALRILATGRIQESAPYVCAKLSEVALFLRIIELCPIPDLQVEKLLTELRKALLLGDAAIEKSTVLGFQIALALHCFTNEFVFAESDNETAAVRLLEEELERSLAQGAKIDPFKILCLASYRPLHRYVWARDLPIEQRLAGLWKRQVRDVLQEASIRTGIPSLKPIDDQISKAVRGQYEENPYPRWVNTQLTGPVTIAAAATRLKLKLVDELQTFSNRPEILVAGCGTGQQALDMASYFANCQVLAVDLSLGSLSYAIRKTRELGISNIDYLQADILDLGILDRQFDVVVSTGVLHHMADPMAGWRILVDCLKPGGLMNIALYSELARKPIVEARKLISAMGLDGSYKDIKRFRELIDQNVDDSLRKVAEWDDFYSVSTCRDLLFHVQEHRFALPQIKKAIDALGLTFVGFAFFGKKASATLTTNRRPEAAYSLDAWHEFETANPATFGGMYQFWVQKTG